VDVENSASWGDRGQRVEHHYGVGPGQGEGCRSIEGKGRTNIKRSGKG